MISFSQAMGLCQSEEEKIGVQKSREIDKQIKKGQSSEEKTIKLLLLGAGECGKSTILKQMRIINKKEYTPEEYAQLRQIVYNNTIDAMSVMMKAMNVHTTSFADPARENDAKQVQDVVKNEKEPRKISPELAVALINLWNDAGVRQLYAEKKSKLHLNENSEHFFNSIHRIAQPDYTPTDTDVLLIRTKTTGIVEVEFQMKKVNFRVFDVGGQRSERKKWIHCFEDVNAIIFIVALSEYDEVLFEDETTNRMVESLRLFESICNSRWFHNTSMILFLNKKDLFEAKITHIPMTPAFPDYKGAQSYVEAITFIKKKFCDLGANPKKNIFTHETCATDSDQVQKILDSVISLIIQTNLHKSGLY